MNELVYLKNDEPVCSSLQVAEKFGKRHTHVIERIEKIIENDSTENSAQCFKASIYKDSTGKSNKMYVMNRDGFTFLVMGFTGKKANEWKWQYIKAFNQMEKFIREKQTKTWIETRKAGKLTRKAETDTIKNLVEYAKAQGSQHADKLYMTYSKLANKMAGVSKRDEATVMQLNNLSLMTEAQQYELGSYVNLMLSSTQLLVNPIIGLKPKYGEDEFEKFILWKGRKAEKELCDDFKPMIISFANFLYKIDIDDKDKKLLYKTFKSNKKMLRALNVKKKEFKIEIFDAVEEALSHSYR